METKYYRFGPVVFAFESEIPYDDQERYEKFRVPASAADYTVDLIPLPADSPCGISEPIQTEICGNTIKTAMNQTVIPNVTVGRLMYLMGAEKLFLPKDAFVLHASYVVRDGKALLFSAPSGTGKSTQAELWRTHRNCEIINGDRVLISRENGEFYANGAYVAGSSGICCNVTVPLGHIVLLEQAPGCAVNPIPMTQKIKRLLGECSFDLQDLNQRMKMMDLLPDLANKVPVICYGCTKGPESVDVLERYL